VSSRQLISRAGLAALGLVAGVGPSLAFAMPGMANPANPHAPAGMRVPGAPPPAASRLVDINSASKAELKTLPGVDDATADRIVAARPYPSKAKLAADQVISFPLFLTLKDRIVALQKLPPATPHPAHGQAPRKP
jgi:hypothetical protein